MPAIGFGTCCRASSTGEPLVRSTLDYLSLGGRLIDTAQMYKNHRDIARAIVRSRVPREQLWVTSKVKTVQGGLGFAQTAAQVDLILEELGLKYVDLLLLHHAKGSHPTERVEQWRALIAAKRAGKARHIGVSNYNREQLVALRATTDVLPEVNQLEFHPWAEPSTFELVRWCQAAGIAVTAYGSLGSSRNAGGAGSGVADVAARHGVSAASVLLQWSLRRGCAVIPGATSREHISENLLMRRIELSREDEALIAATHRPTSWRSWDNMVRDEEVPLSLLATIDESLLRETRSDEKKKRMTWRKFMRMLGPGGAHRPSA